MKVKASLPTPLRGMQRGVDTPISWRKFFLQRQGSRCGARGELRGLSATCVQVRPLGVYALGRNLLLSECDRVWLLTPLVSQT